MALNFNSKGYLHQTVSLTYEEFVTHFGNNARRKRQIDNAIAFFRLFYECGCPTVYVDGSFVSTKKDPADIDLCFDLTDVDVENIEEAFPQFFELNEIGRIHREQQCHLFHFTKAYPKLLNILEEDRDGDPKGLVKLSLKEVFTYDQKRKTI
jgi:hypothetical protein